jgi:acetyl-CoA acetyltransferase
MRSVAVVGIGKTPFGAFPDRDLRSLAVEAGRKCMESAHIQPGRVEAFYLGNFAGPAFAGQNHLAPYVAEGLGIFGIPATRFEDACASGGTAFYHAVSAVAAGLHDLVLVTGVEKMTSQPTPRVAEILASAGDVSGEMKAGGTFPALFAMIARRHMHQFGTTREDLAAVAIKNHANGALNPYAHMRKEVTLEKVLAAYNAGPSRVDEWTRGADDLSESGFINRISIPSTKSYVTSILSRYRNSKPLRTEN